MQLTSILDFLTTTPGKFVLAAAALRGALLVKDDIGERDAKAGAFYSTNPIRAAGGQPNEAGS